MVAIRTAQPLNHTPAGIGSRPAVPDRPTVAPSNVPGPPEADALAEALGTVLAAVHHRAAAVRARVNDVPPREAMDAWCDSLSAFDALAVLADLLHVEVDAPEELFRYAPLGRLRR